MVGKVSEDTANMKLLQQKRDLDPSFQVSEQESACWYLRASWSTAHTRGWGCAGRTLLSQASPTMLHHLTGVTIYSELEEKEEEDDDDDDDDDDDEDEKEEMPPTLLRSFQPAAWL